MTVIRLRRTLRPLVAAAMVVLSLALPLAAPAIAEAPRVLKWADLVPPASASAKPKTFFSGAMPLSGLTPPTHAASPPTDDTTPLPPYRSSDAPWMSERRRSSDGKPAAVVAALDGTKVTLGGYVVALDFDATKVSEFLLVPFVGACIHVPPPPSNQIVYVKAAKPFDVQGQFAPVWVTGTLKTEPSFTGLADAGYTLSADVVAARAP